MKRKIILSLTIILTIFNIIFSNAYASFKDLDLSARNVGVYEMDTMRELYVKNPDQQISIASITKLMTAIVCIENVKDLNKKVVVDLPECKKYYNYEYSVAGLKDKQEISYLDLIGTMLAPSGADSAAAIALNTFGDYNKFIEEMNKKAKVLGMNHTSFSNVIGADDPNNYSTVRDLAILNEYALKNDIIKNALTVTKYTTTDKKMSVNNALFILGEIYGIDIHLISGGKTGMTGDALYCLTSYSDKLDENIMCIVMGSEIQSGTLKHLTDTEKIYEYIESNFEQKDMVSVGEPIITLPTYHAVQEEIKVCAVEPITLFVDKDTIIDKSKVQLKYEGCDVLNSGIKKGDVIGLVEVYYDGKHIKDAKVTLDKPVIFSISKWAKDNPELAMVYFILIMIFIIFIYIRVRIFKKKKEYVVKM